jgi:hypothetical protein
MVEVVPIPRRGAIELGLAEDAQARGLDGADQARGEVVVWWGASPRAMRW